jgi:DNA-binding transcriptional MerR regulator
MLRIGTFARLAGTSPKTLRDYDGLGLFRPAWVDPATGYRAYSPAQLPELRRILALRGMGVGLAEIGHLVSGGADMRTVLDRRRTELELEREEIDRRLAALDIHLGAAGGAGSLDVVIRPVAAESVATLELAPGGGDIGAAFYELEAHLRDHGRRARRPPGTLVHPGSSSGGRAVEVFVPVRGLLAPTDRIRYRRLPGARMATIIHHGAYGTLPATRGALEGWVTAAGLASAGPLRILYLQFGAETELRLPRDYLVDRDADFVTELQLPVG